MWFTSLGCGRVCRVHDCDYPNFSSKFSSDISSCGSVIVMVLIVRFKLSFVGDHRVVVWSCICSLSIS